MTSVIGTQPINQSFHPGDCRRAESGIKDMLGWIVRFVMFIASIITGWFVARDTASFDVIEMVVSLLLIIVFLAVGAFWPYLVAWFADRRAARRSGAPSGAGNIRP